MARTGSPRTISPRDYVWFKAQEIADKKDIRGRDKKPSVTGLFERLIEEDYKRTFNK